jgi:hypothetical protein
MIDRKLLELAAKAAGFKEINYQYGVALELRHGFTEAIWNGESYWNPLENDGDALRLAVKLQMKIYPGEAYPWDKASATYSHKYGASVDEDENPDQCAATRRAIVRAAAEIGKAMPCSN